MTVRILEGDVRARLADVPEQSVQCCVTSPPYYGLRDYGVSGQIGLEPTLAEYIATMVAVFRDVRRVLRDDGTLWLNIGDSYCSTPAGNSDATFSDKQRSNGGSEIRRSRSNVDRVAGLKAKDLMMVPARLALALQDDGWYLRSDIIWKKPNPMPESVTDRPTSAHEHIFLLTKKSRYYYDADAIREDAVWNRDHNPEWDRSEWLTSAYQGVRSDPAHQGLKVQQSTGSRNCRNVWTIATKPFSEAHFATFPPELPRRCIKAGSKPGDTILDPFAGAGTTLLVADQLGRDAVGIELNPTYAALIELRLKENAPMFVSIERVAVSEQVALL